MKKEYVKPEMFYENFELSHHVASCNVLGDDVAAATNSHDKSTCVYQWLGGDPLFMEGNSNCVTDVAKKFEQYCYQTNTEGVTFFAS